MTMTSIPNIMQTADAHGTAWSPQQSEHCRQHVSEHSVSTASQQRSTAHHGTSHHAMQQCQHRRRHSMDIGAQPLCQCQGRRAQPFCHISEIFQFFQFFPRISHFSEKSRKILKNWQKSEKLKSWCIRAVPLC